MQGCRGAGVHGPRGEMEWGGMVAVVKLLHNAGHLFSLRWQSLGCMGNAFLWHV
jgi:hypothetical protein